MNINNIKINGKISTKFGCALTHTFELNTETQNGFELEFSLPDNAAVTGLSVSSDGGCFSAGLIELAQNKKNGFMITQNSEGKCRIICSDAQNSRRITLEVSSVLLLSLCRGYTEITIPLVTECDTVVRSQTEREKTICADSDVIIDFLIDGDFVSRVNSATHNFQINNRDDGLHLYTETVTRGNCVLWLEYNAAQKDGGFENTAYLTGGNGTDWTGVYLFSVSGSGGSRCADNDLLYILDPDSFKNTSGHIAAECLQELVRRQKEYSKCLIASSDGHVFCDKALKKSEIDFGKLGKWIYSLESNAFANGLNINQIISGFKQTGINREIVLVTCSGEFCDWRVYNDLRINILSVSENCFERELKELAESSGGIYARMNKKTDYTMFIEGFSERLNSRCLKNLKILEYSPGTYFNLPDKINSYRMGDVIVYTFRSTADCPKQLFLEADGGFSDIVRFEKIITLPDSDENNAVFAKKVFTELYGYIARGDIAPESVSEFKAQAAKLSRELKVICPETAYLAGVESIGERSYSSDIIIRLGSKPKGYAEDVTVFGDSTVIISGVREKLIYLGVCALLVCMRADFRFTSPCGSLNADLETMYAAAAIYRAADAGYVPDKAAYISIADKAVAAAGGKNRFDTAAIDFGGTETLSLYDAKMILDGNNVTEISRLILRLCRDRNMC